MPHQSSSFKKNYFHLLFCFLSNSGCVFLFPSCSWGNKGQSNFILVFEIFDNYNVNDKIPKREDFSVSKPEQPFSQKRTLISV